MNERIKLLAEQAGIHPSNFEPDADIKLSLEKFAELIVRECSLVCDLYAMPDGTSQTAMILSAAIKSKFGVSDEIAN